MLPDIQNVDTIRVDWMKRWAEGLVHCESSWETVAEGIESLRTYHRNEEHLGADMDPVNPECIDSMVALLAHLKVEGFVPPWCLYPAPNGGVMAEWTFDYKPGESEHGVIRLETEWSTHSSVYLTPSTPRKAEAMFTTGLKDPAVFADIEF